MRPRGAREAISIHRRRSRKATHRAVAEPNSIGDVPVGSSRRRRIHDAESCSRRSDHWRSSSKSRPSGRSGQSLRPLSKSTSCHGAALLASRSECNRSRNSNHPFRLFGDGRGNIACLRLSATRPAGHELGIQEKSGKVGREFPVDSMSRTSTQIGVITADQAYGHCHLGHTRTMAIPSSRFKQHFGVVVNVDSLCPGADRNQSILNFAWPMTWIRCIDGLACCVVSPLHSLRND